MIYSMIKSRCCGHPQERELISVVARPRNSRARDEITIIEVIEVMQRKNFDWNDVTEQWQKKREVWRHLTMVAKFPHYNHE